MCHRLDGRCSHVGALLFKLQEFRRCNTMACASSTLKLCRWSEPRSCNITPHQLSDIPFEQTHLNKGTTNIIITGIISFKIEILKFTTTIQWPFFQDNTAQPIPEKQPLLTPWFVVGPIIHLY